MKIKSASLPCFVLALAAGTVGLEVAAQQTARPYKLPIQCPKGTIATTAERGCIQDRTAEIAAVKGAEFRQGLKLGGGVASVPPQATVNAKNRVAEEPNTSYSPAIRR